MLYWGRSFSIGHRKMDWYGKVSVGIMKAICIPHEGAVAPSFFNKLIEAQTLDIIA